MYTIRLNNLKMFAHHGLHEEETIIGTDFEVSLAVSFNPPAEITLLSETVDYVSMYNIIKDRFSTPVKLLETLAYNISEDIYMLDARISLINITIDKINPPISNFAGTVGIAYSKSFS